MQIVLNRISPRKICHKLLGRSFLLAGTISFCGLICLVFFTKRCLGRSFSIILLSIVVAFDVYADTSLYYLYLYNKHLNAEVDKAIEEYRHSYSIIYGQDDPRTFSKALFKDPRKN